MKILGGDYELQNNIYRRKRKQAICLIALAIFLGWFIPCVLTPAIANFVIWTGLVR